MTQLGADPAVWLAALPRGTCHMTQSCRHSIWKQTAGARKDSQLLPDTAQPGLGVGQLHGQVLLVLAGEAAGGAGGGLGAARPEWAGRLLRLQVVPLLCQVHDELWWVERGGEGRPCQHPGPAGAAADTPGQGMGEWGGGRGERGKERPCQHLALQGLRQHPRARAGDRMGERRETAREADKALQVVKRTGVVWGRRGRGQPGARAWGRAPWLVFPGPSPPPALSEATHLRALVPLVQESPKMKHHVPRQGL